MSASLSSHLAVTLFGHRFADVHEPWRTLFSTPGFAPHQHPAFAERVELTYRRLHDVNAAIDDVAKFVNDPQRLAAFHEWAGAVDGGLAAIAGIHYNLFLGSLTDHGRSLTGYERLERIGTFLCTELGYGNNAAQLETTAVRDRHGFVLHTPSPAAAKFMPNTSPAGGPKTGVVAARLLVEGADEGVMLFLVPMDAPGVHVRLLQPRIGPPIDHCLTTFTHVRLGPDALLQGPQGRFASDGTFLSDIGNRRLRLLASIARVTTGKFCMSAAALGGGRQALALAVRYAHIRRAAALTGRNAAQVPLWSYRSHHAPLLEALATAYAATLLHRSALTRWEHALTTSGADREEAEIHAALTKAWITWQVRQILIECRERCGAQGLFPVNGLADYLSTIEGPITAEGDNLPILVKAAAHLVMGHAGESPAARPPDTSPADPDFLQYALRRGEDLHRQRARAALRAPAGGSLSRWNHAAGPALRLAEATAARMACQALLSAARTTPDAQAADLLLILHRLLALRLLAPCTGDLLAAGQLRLDHIEQLHVAREQAIAELAPHATTLIDAFMIPEDVFARHPIALPDWDQFVERIPAALAGPAE
ncbi:acyl-CoA dehydrogenase [Nonomuraea sp. NPDC046802]|uniref:acyl-CoA dehydrogenase family protein n=1 Tax=Nonomuraea sp. NPDC046802 TaxID=3154919 RepID=UPI0033C38B46